MEQKTLKAAPEAPQFTITDYSQPAQEEIRQLMNIERFLKRVKEITGDEAFAYVDARQYLAGKAAMIGKAEEARLIATAKAAAPKVVPIPPAEETK
jgi:hypothetical protein